VRGPIGEYGCCSGVSEEAFPLRADAAGLLPAHITQSYRTARMR
jgi:hypothetical protein